MDWPTLCTALLGAVPISAVVSALYARRLEVLRARLGQERDQAIERLRAELTGQRDRDIEKVKSDLAREFLATQHLAERRLEVYPLAVDRVYRIRNIAGGLASSAGHESDAALASEFGARTSELRECMYKYRFDMQRDGVWMQVHEFVKTAERLVGGLEDWAYLQKRGDQGGLPEVVARIRAVHGDIERLYIPLVDLLSNVDPADGMSTGPAFARTKGS
jgi:hypothetical protein